MSAGPQREEYRRLSYPLRLRLSGAQQAPIRISSGELAIVPSRKIPSLRARQGIRHWRFESFSEPQYTKAQRKKSQRADPRERNRSHEISRQYAYEDKQRHSDELAKHHRSSA